MRGKMQWIAVGCAAIAVLGSLLLHPATDGGVVLSPISVEQRPIGEAEYVTESDMASAPFEAEKQPPEGGGHYLLKDYMDRVAIYRVFGDGTQVLVQIADIDVRTLPKHDVTSLEKGIYVQNEDALIRILEDFSS